MEVAKTNIQGVGVSLQKISTKRLAFLNTVLFRHVGGSRANLTKTKARLVDDFECEILFAPPENQEQNEQRVTEHYPLVKILDSRKHSKLKVVLPYYFWF